MSWWQIIPGVLQAGGTLLSAESGVKSSKIERSRLRRLANAERAEASFNAQEAKRQSELQLSRAQAVAAATGGSTNDPDVINIMGDLDAYGEYEVARSIFEGETGARSTELEGEERVRQSRLNRRAAVLDSASSLYKAYGGKAEYE